MTKSLHDWYERIDLASVLSAHAGLRVVPSTHSGLRLAGSVSFEGPGQDDEIISDSYDIELWVPNTFPADEPTVRETGGRIPPDYHKLDGDDLCLGAPTAIRLKLAESPTLPAFLEYFVIPYLFGYSFFVRYGTMPFGELAHGDAGIYQYFCELFSAPDAEYVVDFLGLAGMKKSAANKEPCPCGSGKRLGRCHNRRVNHLRRQFGRITFRAEYERIAQWILSRRR